MYLKSEVYYAPLNDMWQAVLDTFKAVETTTIGWYKNPTTSKKYKISTITVEGNNIAEVFGNLTHEIYTVLGRAQKSEYRFSDPDICKLLVRMPPEIMLNAITGTVGMWVRFTVLLNKVDEGWVGIDEVKDEH